MNLTVFLSCDSTVTLVDKPQLSARRWWRTPLIPALRRQSQADLCEFETSLVYRASARTTSKATEKPCLENPHSYLTVYIRCAKGDMNQAYSKCSINVLL
ncbi:hypothetical protein I79_018299 [Cricetulus griseus]|uniref:Uncharacterized protein n=1 Tax=Cricetulus griseus TaxID=10029 RepID=G3I4C2_CRIGR|nr:hypothetical protein I79_018299 [Cricetulus griseus]